MLFIADSTKWTGISDCFFIELCVQAFFLQTCRTHARTSGCAHDGVYVGLTVCPGSQIQCFLFIPC